MLRPLTKTLAFAACAIALSGLAAPNAAYGQALTAAERARLNRGELVTRPGSQRSGGNTQFGGSSFQVIDLPPEVVWDTIQDARLFRRMLPQLEGADVVRRSGNSQHVRFEHHSGPVHITYTMVLDYVEADHTMLFRLDETQPHDIDAGWGYLRIRPHGQNKTLVSFGAMLGVGDGVLAGALRPTVQEWVLKVPLTMKWYLDRRRQQLLASR